HWAMPRSMWKQLEAAKGKQSSQVTLDSAFKKVETSREFKRKDVLHAVATLIACDDQALALANKASFRNCLVAMRPRSITADLPSTHNVCAYLHNEFTKILARYRADIEV
ncbi:hypothetical protein BV25DRAFT_1769205, partial [Artomyces pyxidatus]